MEIKNLSGSVVLFKVEKGPKLEGALTSIRKYAAENVDYDIILDFIAIDTMTSENLGSLMCLREMLNACGRELIICRIPFHTKCIFTVVGLDKIFIFADKSEDAMDILKKKNQPQATNTG